MPVFLDGGGKNEVLRDLGRRGVAAQNRDRELVHAGCEDGGEFLLLVSPGRDGNVHCERLVLQALDCDRIVGGAPSVAASPEINSVDEVGRIPRVSGSQKKEEDASGDAENLRAEPQDPGGNAAAGRSIRLFFGQPGEIPQKFVGRRFVNEHEFS